MKKTLLILTFIVFCFSTNTTQADCDKKAAKSLIQDILNQGVATRKDTGITIFYTMRINWSQLSDEQKYNFASGLGNVENCLRDGVAVRIRSAGKDVAKSQGGNTKIFK